MTHPRATRRGSTTTDLQQRSLWLDLTARPETFAERFRNSSAVWLALMAYWAIADILLTIFPNSSGRQLPPDSWLTHLAFTLIGLAAIWCMHHTRFPAAWDKRIPAGRRLMLPLVVGSIFGVLAIAMELYFGTLRDMQEVTGTKVTVGFPQSLLTYSSGAIYLEFMFLVAPVSLLLWLISNVILRGRAQAPTFWVLAVLASTIESALQGPAVLAAAQGAIDPLAFGLYAVHNFGFNFGAAVLFRRYGLLAPVLVRLGDYMIWHVLFGNLFL
jgi:hypothetical protein